MTLKLGGVLDILKMYYHTENEVARLRHSKLLTVDEICVANEKKYENSSRCKVNVTNFQPLLAFTMGHSWRAGTRGPCLDNMHVKFGDSRNQK